jgi:hypothetical protein
MCLQTFVCKIFVVDFMFDVNLTTCLLHVAGGGVLSNIETNNNGIYESCVDPTIDGGKCVVNIVTFYFLVNTTCSYFLLLLALRFYLI